MYVASGVAGGSRGAKQSPPLGSGPAKIGFCADPLIGRPTHVLCMILHMALGTMVFGPWYFVDPAKGTTVMF